MVAEHAQHASNDSSMVAELAEYLGVSMAVMCERCATATAELAQAWREAAPATPEAITAFYRQADGYLYDLTWWHAQSEERGAPIHAAALQTATAQRAQTVLDFGSGIGSLGLLLATHGMAVTLAEINPHLHAYARWRFARRGLSAGFLDPTTEQLPDEAFDCITAIDVFEHLPDPAATLAMLTLALRPGGTLFIHLPNAPDDAHPMHLWHDPDLLLRHLHEYGLWLAHAADSTLILRRGEGPRYALARGLQLIEGNRSGLLLLLSPLVAIDLNAQAFALLAALAEHSHDQNGGATAEEVAEQTTVSLIDIAAFYASLADSRLLTRKPPLTGVWPHVSVIIPAYGRPEATRACIESLLALDYPADHLEIIVIDDASDPPLAPALHHLPIRLIRQEQNIGQSAVRNHAATIAQGDVLAFIDNDCIALPDWLRALVPYLEDASIGVVGGRVIAPPPDGPTAAFEAVRSPLDMGANGGEVGGERSVMYLPTCNMLVRRDVMLQQHGFDAAMLLGEDVDFIWRVQQAGWRVFYAPEGQVIHYHRVQLGPFLHRRMEYGSSEADLQQRHPHGRRVMPLPAVSLALLTALVVRRTSPRAGAVLALAALASIAAELGHKAYQLHQAGAAIPLHQVASAVLRQHIAALYHLGANTTRYYSLPLLLACLRGRSLIPSALILLLLPPLHDYHRQRPQMSLPAFVGLYWLEMAAYQVGVWRGCGARRTLRPLLPLLRLVR